MLERYLNPDVVEAGIDEAGRGCLAGPVVAAAVILPPGKDLEWYEVLNDSKQLPEALRETLRILIERDALAWGVGMAMPEEIDRINILNATFRAMHEAVSRLNQEPQYLLIDGTVFLNIKPSRTVALSKVMALIFPLLQPQCLQKRIATVTCVSCMNIIRITDGTGTKRTRQRHISKRLNVMA
jgi:ribonuclease HII